MVRVAAEQDSTSQTETHSKTHKSSSKPIYITKTGAFIKFSDLADDIKLISRIEKYFTLKTELFTGKTHQIKSIKVDKVAKRMIVPRFGLPYIMDKYNLDFKPVSQLKSGKRINITWQGTQTANQKIISDCIMSEYYTEERVADGSAGLILNLEAGQGKSYLAAYLAGVIGRRTAIILHSTSLIKQWVQVLTRCFGEDVSIG